MFLVVVDFYATISTMLLAVFVRAVTLGLDGGHQEEEVKVEQERAKESSIKLTVTYCVFAEAAVLFPIRFLFVFTASS